MDQELGRRTDERDAIGTTRGSDEPADSEPESGNPKTTPGQTQTTNAAVSDASAPSAPPAPNIAQLPFVEAAASAPAWLIDQPGETTPVVSPREATEAPQRVIHGETPVAGGHRAADTQVRSGVAVSEQSPVAPQHEAVSPIQSTLQPTISSEAGSTNQVEQPTEVRSGNTSASDHRASDDPQGKQRDGSALLDRDVPRSEQTPAIARAEQVDAGIRLAQLDRTTAGSSQASTGLAPTPVVAGGSTVSAIASAATPAHSEVQDTQSANRVTSHAIKGMTAMLGHRGGVMTMRLDPPELGQLRIQMAVQSARVSVTFEVQSIQATTMLREGMAQLRTSLEQHGLSVERLNVNTAQPQQQMDTGDRSSTDKDGRHEPDARQGRSRGRNEDQAHRHDAHPESQSLDQSFASWMDSPQVAQAKGSER